MALSPAPIALAVVTIDRPSLVLRLLRSARRRFPDMPIYVADQSHHVATMVPLYAALGVRLVQMEYDAGVTASRNRLVDAIEEDYFVLCDDDFILRHDTSFDDALAILRADPIIGVVGGCLLETSTLPAYYRHWELYLHLSRSCRRLTAIPIHHYLPERRSLDHISYYICDAVVNFAVFRRSMFSDRIRWDEQFKSNGEHEDFYLNLKFEGTFAVSYLPTLMAEHNHPALYPGYQHRLRDRAEGWRLFMNKWGIDRYLDIGGGVRKLDDPGTVLNETAARRALESWLPSVLSHEDPPEQKSLETSGLDIHGLRLFCKYDPILSEDDDLLIWCMVDRGRLGDGSASDLTVWFRWFASDDTLLVWRSDEFRVSLAADYWQPLSPLVPVAPPGRPWLRFEIVAHCRSGPNVVALGLVLVPTNAAAAQALGDVLALSPLPDPIAGRSGLWNRITARPPEAALDEGLSVESIGPDGAATLVEATERLPAAATAVVFMDWMLARGGAIVSGQFLQSDIAAPKRFVIPAHACDRLPGIVAVDRMHAPVAACVAAHPALPSLVSGRADLAGQVTVVLTSCGRPDLLERTLESFFAFNTCPIRHMIVVEDGNPGRNAALMRRFRDYRITWIGTQRNVGQIRAIDLGYSLVETQAIFHLEDDWEFYAPGFIEKSAAILSADRSCLQIWLRALDDTNGHPLDPGVDRVGGVDVRRLTFGYLGEWHGFSFNPGLRRTADYRRLGDFRRHTQFARREHGAPEMIISTLYRDLGMHAAILADNDGRGYVHHIGEGRSLRPST